MLLLASCVAECGAAFVARRPPCTKTFKEGWRSSPAQARAWATASPSVSPIDAIAPIAAKRTPLPFAACRVIQDVLVMGVALLVGGPVGVFTIVSALCIGPLIALWNRAASLPMYERFGVLSKREVAEEA